MTPEPLPEEASGKGKGRTSWLVRAGMIVTIGASIAGLVFTGVATWYSAAVADDQLKQSREAEEEKERAQAALISYWVDLQHNGRSRLHLMNRSPDPISEVQMTFAVTLPSDGRDNPRVFFAVKMPSVPPCSDMLFTPDDMSYSENRLAAGDFLVPQWVQSAGDKFRKEWHPLPIEAFLADFSDRDGVRWRRTGGLLTREPGDPKAKRARLVGYVQAKATSPKPLKSCKA
ncbi:hypothetical protein [Streptomyces sp. NPDC054887]